MHTWSFALLSDELEAFLKKIWKKKFMISQRGPLQIDSRDFECRNLP